jgi:prepilin-type N-terminal cleavage/methylation domain-containing protein
MHLTSNKRDGPSEKTATSKFTPLKAGLAPYISNHERSEWPRRRNPPRNGLTLIELLIAIAITVLLVGVVGLIYGAALNTLRHQALGRAALQPAADALATLQRDLVGALAPQDGSNAAFALVPGGAAGPGSFSLHFFTTRPGAGSNDWRAYGIHEVAYALEAEAVTGCYALVRLARPFRTTAPLFNAAAATAGGSPPAVSGAEVIARSLAGLELLVSDGENWTNTWTGGAADNALPRAARITLQLAPPAGTRRLSSETLIPAGHTIRAAGGTNLSRAGAPKKSI